MIMHVTVVIYSQHWLAYVLVLCTCVYLRMRDVSTYTFWASERMLCCEVWKRTFPYKLGARGRKPP